MQISKARRVGSAGAALLGAASRAADKIVGGTLRGQAPLPFYIAVHKVLRRRKIRRRDQFRAKRRRGHATITAGAFDVVLSVGSPIRFTPSTGAPPPSRIIGNVAPYALSGNPGLKSIADLKGKAVRVGGGRANRPPLFGAHGRGEGSKRDDYDEPSARRRRGTFRGAQGRRRRCGNGSAAAQLLAKRMATLRLALPPIMSKDLPFTGMAVRRALGARTRRSSSVLAATDKSIAWLPIKAHRGEAIDFLSAPPTPKEDVDASYDCCAASTISSQQQGVRAQAAKSYRRGTPAGTIELRYARAADHAGRNGTRRLERAWCCCSGLN